MSRKKTIFSIGILMAGTAAGQLIQLLSSPVLTHIFDPEQFGIYSFFVSIFAIAVPLTTLRFDHALVIAHQSSELKYLLRKIRTSLLWSLGISFVFGLMFWFFNDRVLWVYLAPALLGAAGFHTCSALLNRYRNYNLLSVATFVRAVLMVSLFLVLGHFWNGSFLALLWGHSSAWIISALIIYLGIRKTVLAEIQQDDTKAISQAEVQKKFDDFPRYNLPNALLTAASANLPISIIVWFFNEVLGGFYGLLIRLLFVPVGIISQSVYRVFYQRCSQKVGRKQSLKNDIRGLSLIFMGSGIVIASLIPFVDNLVEMFLGEKWQGIQKMIPILLPVSWVMLVSGSLAFIPLVFHKQKQSLWIESTYISVRLVSLLVGGLLLDFNNTLILFSVMSVLVAGLRLFYYFKVWRNYEIHSVNH